MLKLLIDHQTFSLQNYGGISRYFGNIHNAIDLREDIVSEIGLLYTQNYYIKDYAAPLNNIFGRLLLRKKKKIAKWNKQYSSYLIKQNKFDLLHPSYYNTYFLKDLKKPFVITVHDMIHERLPEYFDPNEDLVKNKRLCVENAAHIIAISEATKNDLVQILNVNPERITTIHHGYHMNIELDDEMDDHIPHQMGNYLLYVGDRRGYKNFSVFINAIAPLLHEEKSLMLICAGGGGFKSSELELIKRLKLDNKIFQAHATDAQLKNYYSNARAFVFPSVYEGFGLPILEAFKYQCPVAASDSACFREIGENAISYFDPYDKHSILKVVKDIISNTSTIQTLIKEGQSQLQKFSMDACMNKTIAVYQRISL